MLTFFKTNDPYRLAGVFLLLLVIRMPMFLTGVPMVLPELKWLLIGERLGSSDLQMYQDVWDSTGPLAIWVYKWLFVVFGKTRIPYLILSCLLVVVQAGVFNHVMLRNKAYNTSTYVPALVYMVCMNAYFDFLTLSPILLSMTFILLAMSNLFKRMDNHTKDELFILTGIYLGLATLFYLPSVCYFIVTILSLLIYTGSIVRRMLLLLYGFGLVLGLVSVYFYWEDNYLIFQHHFIQSLWVTGRVGYLSWTALFTMSVVPLSIFVLSWYKVKKLGKYINFQHKIQQVMLMFFFSCILGLMMSREVSTYQLIYFVPPVAFFVAHYLLLIRHWLIAEATMGLIVVGILCNHLTFSNAWFHIDEFVSYEDALVSKSTYAKVTKGKKILVIGDAISHYDGALLATPYVNWPLSKIQLNQLNYYDNSAEVFVNFNRDFPEVIIDQEGVIPQLFAIMPTIAFRYIHHKHYPEVYLLKE